ncbi:MAG: MFS transporter, partial [Campylobacter sp.]|nr:MFS transporter [Campylobacter sp.]
EIHSIIWAVSYTAGMGLAGIYIHFFGIKSAFILDGLIYVCSFYFLSSLKISYVKSNFVESNLKMLKNGLVYLKQNKLVVHLIFLHAVVGVTAYDALIALLADYKYVQILSVSLVIGFINAMRSVALMVSPMLLSKFVNKNNLVYIYVGHGLGIILWAFCQQNFYIGLIGVMAAGFFTSTLWSYTYTLLQQNCDKNFYGRVIAYNDMIYLGVSALVSLAIGSLFKLGASLEAITALMGIIFFLGAFYYVKILNRYDIK